MRAYKNRMSDFFFYGIGAKNNLPKMTFLTVYFQNYFQ